MRNTRQEREDLARRKEQWILRTGQGEDPDTVCQELNLHLKASSLPRLRQRYNAGGRKWRVLLERRHGWATKGTAAVKAFLQKAKTQHPQATSPELRAQVWERFEIDLSLSRLKEILHAEGLSNAPGRPRKALPPESAAPTERDLDHAGAFFPSGRLDRTRRPRRREKRP